MTKKYSVEVEIDGKIIVLESDVVCLSKTITPRKPNGYEELIIKYPSIFEQVGMSPRESCMAFGIECSSGWFELIDNGCYFLDKIYQSTGIKVVAHQVKEKFGGLRFYYGVEYPKKYTLHKDTDEADWTREQKDSEQSFHMFSNRIQAIVGAMEGASYSTCDQCGKPGKARGGGWIVTNCDECDAAFKKAKALDDKIMKDWVKYKSGLKKDEEVTPYHIFKKQYKEQDDESNRSEDGDRS